MVAAKRKRAKRASGSGPRKKKEEPKEVEKVPGILLFIGPSVSNLYTVIVVIELKWSTFLSRNKNPSFLANKMVNTQVISW